MKKVNILTSAVIALLLGVGATSAFSGELPVASQAPVQAEVVPTLSETQAQLAQVRGLLTQAELASDYLPTAELEYRQAQVDTQNGYYDKAVDSLNKVRAEVAKIPNRNISTLASR
jgi:Spy/CpxP family protein refolding chaperone